MQPKTLTTSNKRYGQTAAGELQGRSKGGYAGWATIMWRPVTPSGADSTGAFAIDLLFSTNPDIMGWTVIQQIDETFASATGGTKALTFPLSRGGFIDVEHKRGVNVIVDVTG